MSKRKNKIASVKESRPASAINTYLVALQRVAALVNGFAYVQNPPTQFVQREVSAKVKVTLAGRKTPLDVDLKEYIPARSQDAKGRMLEQSKRYARALLTAYAIGKVSNPESEVKNLAAYLAAKVMTSRPRSLEGVMSAQALTTLESTSGIKVIACGESSRENLDAKIAELFNYLEAGIAGGFIFPVRGRRKLNHAADLNL